MYEYACACMCVCVYVYMNTGQKNLNNYLTDASMQTKLSGHVTNIMINQSLVEVKVRK